MARICVMAPCKISGDYQPFTVHLRFHLQGRGGNNLPNHTVSLARRKQYKFPQLCKLYFTHAYAVRLLFISYDYWMAYSSTKFSCSSFLMITTWPTAQHCLAAPHFLRLLAYSSTQFSCSSFLTITEWPTAPNSLAALHFLRLLTGLQLHRV